MVFRHKHMKIEQTLKDSLKILKESKSLSTFKTILKAALRRVCKRL